MTTPDSAAIARIGQTLASRLAKGDRRALARAITLVESTRLADEQAAEVLLKAVLPATGKAMRIGISGAPGVGKSTFIEAFGMHLTAHDKHVAVFAIDPSSRRSGGSILGDKTRMERLARHNDAFIRPSPAGTTLGGVARRTRESMLLAEAAGFDVVLVETVGVGQSETAVADMTDLFVLLVSPGGGDDLQGIKRGVMELADLLIVTKADGEFLAAANRAAADYQAALHLMRPKHKGLQPSVLTVSALEGVRIEETWIQIQSIHAHLESSGQLQGLRGQQNTRWFWNEMQMMLQDRIFADPILDGQFRNVEADVLAGKVLPSVAARTLLSHLVIG